MEIVGRIILCLVRLAMSLIVVFVVGSLFLFLWFVVSLLLKATGVIR